MASVALNGSAPVPLAIGQDLLGAMLDAGLPAMYLCMAGSCGRCRCRVAQGLAELTPPTGAEDDHGCAGDHRLACQARLAAEADILVHQPAR